MEYTLPRGLYRVHANSVANFQAKMHPLFAAEIENLKAWLDDFILYA